MLTTLSHLPPQASLSLFYHISFVLALITIAYLVYAYIAAHRAAHLTSAPTSAFSLRAREWLVHGLGALWLLDGLLQAQPLMVTRFIGGFLAPLVTGQPGLVVWLIDGGIRVWSVSPVLWNVLAEFTQIGIGLGLLFGRPNRGQRVALWVSLVWGSIVWIAGEGVGGVFAGGGWLTGAPGSVFLYMLAAILVLGPERWWGSDRPQKIVRWFMVGLLSFSVLLEVWPPAGWWTAHGLGGYVFSMAAMPQPTELSVPLYAWSHLLTQHPVFWNALITAGLAGFATLWVVWPRQRWVWLATLVWVFLGWWLGQDFGVLGGMGTDPNSGVILLLGLLVYGDVAGFLTLPAWKWMIRTQPSSSS